MRDLSMDELMQEGEAKVGIPAAAGDYTR